MIRFTPRSSRAEMFQHVLPRVYILWKRKSAVNYIHSCFNLANRVLWVTVILVSYVVCKSRVCRVLSQLLTQESSICKNCGCYYFSRHIFPHNRTRFINLWITECKTVFRGVHHPPADHSGRAIQNRVYTRTAEHVFTSSALLVYMRPKAWTVFARSNATQGMDVCIVSVYSMCR
jgi:hypothetical protein